jgi:hypothetical protein
MRTIFSQAFLLFILFECWVLVISPNRGPFFWFRPWKNQYQILDYPFLKKQLKILYKKNHLLWNVRCNWTHQCNCIIIVNARLTPFMGTSPNCCKHLVIVIIYVKNSSAYRLLLRIIIARVRSDSKCQPHIVEMIGCKIHRCNICWQKNWDVCPR